MREAHAKQCRELQENCLQWKRIVEDLQRELCGAAESQELPPWGRERRDSLHASSTATATATAWSKPTSSSSRPSLISSANGSALSPQGKEDISRQVTSESRAQQQQHGHYVPQSNHSSSPALPAASEPSLSTLLHRLEQQERELSSFRHHMSESAPVSDEDEGYRQQSRPSPPHWIDRASLSTTSRTAAAPSALSPMSARELLDSPAEKEFLLRSLQREFDSHLLSSSKFVNDKLSQQQLAE
jgi:hypothetical protein